MSIIHSSASKVTIFIVLTINNYYPYIKLITKLEIFLKILLKTSLTSSSTSMTKYINIKETE